MRALRHYTVLLVLLLLPLGFVAAQSESRPASDPATAESKAALVDDFAKALMIAKENYAGQVNYDKVVKGAALGMLRTLDPHSSYLDSNEWKNYKNSQQSRYSGIGSIIGERNGKVYIVSPINGTPAYRAGLRFGDQIIEVNGDSTEGWSTGQTSERLVGIEGTPVSMKIRRLGVREPIELKLVRGAVPLPSISTYCIIGKEIGYISLQRSFNTTTHDEMLLAIEELRGLGMKALILDLRNNRGGLVEQAWKVAGIFLYRGQKIASIAGRPPVYHTRNLLSYNEKPDDYPLVVLTNRLTASSAEIVAGALQDHDRALIVGERTFGKGLVQSLFELADGSALTLTTGRYRTPSGRLIQRDYSKGSFYDYYLQRNHTASKPSERGHQTDAGRSVYEGGGITPDVELALSPREGELQQLWLDPVFEFVRQLVAGQVRGLEAFRISTPIDYAHRLGNDEYLVDDKVIAAFKAFLNDARELRADRARVDKDAAFLKRQIRFELVTAAYGQDTALKVLLEGDSQAHQAIADIPKAVAMADALRQVWKTINQEPQGKTYR